MKYIKEGTEFLDQLKDKVHDLYEENKELKKERKEIYDLVKKNDYPENILNEILIKLEGKDNEQERNI